MEAFAMTGMDGINSLQKMLGALTVNGSTNVSGAAAAGKTGSSATALESSVKVTGNTVDSANLSAAGGLASSQATDTSDVRMSKVAELKAAISGGAYNVSASAVADKMVEGMLK